MARPTDIDSRVSSDDTGIWLRLAAFVFANFSQVCGYWLLATSVNVLVYLDTHDPLLLTMLVSLELVPQLIVSPYAGVLMDRYDRRVVLAIATGCEILAVATVAVLATVGTLSTLAMLASIFVLGLLGAVDMPARASIVPTMVRPADIQRSVAIGNIAYPAARVVGPAAAGVLLGLIGPAFTIWLATILYATLLPALPLARPLIPTLRAALREQSPTFRQGLTYLGARPLISVLLGFSVLVGIFGWIPLALMPAIATDLLGSDATGIGLLLSASALGSLASNSILATGRLKVTRAEHLIWPVLLMCAAIAALGYSRDMNLSLALVFAGGITLSITYTGSLGLVHHLVDDRFRGRIVGIQTAGIAASLVPYLALGLLARAGGVGLTLVVTGVVTAILGVALTALSQRHRSAPGPAPHP